tara:strand:- start:1270 stop:1959 length:690 start_codon:yes stop_codon:yes gene_type:complete
MNHNVYVISAGRHDSLNFTEQQKSEYIFCVKNGEGKLYKMSGCKNVYETGTLMQSRNFALIHAFDAGKICVQLSDDLTQVRVNKHPKRGEKVDSYYAISEIADKLAKTKGVYLIGVPPTDNPFFAKDMVKKNAFCIGDMLFIKPSDPRFDEKLTLKEDYDFTLQHIEKYGVCIRYQKYMWSFKHYDNKGGAVDYRSEIEEKKNIRYLKAKWGSKIALNPKRKNEIVLKL